MKKGLLVACAHAFSPGARVSKVVFKLRRWLFLYHEDANMVRSVLAELFEKRVSDKGFDKAAEWVRNKGEMLGVNPSIIEDIIFVRLYKDDPERAISAARTAILNGTQTRQFVRTLRADFKKHYAMQGDLASVTRMLKIVIILSNLEQFPACSTEYYYFKGLKKLEKASEREGCFSSDLGPLIGIERLVEFLLAYFVEQPVEIVRQFLDQLCSDDSSEGELSALELILCVLADRRLPIKGIVLEKIFSLYPTVSRAKKLYQHWHGRGYPTEARKYAQYLNRECPDDTTLGAVEDLVAIGERGITDADIKSVPARGVFSGSSQLKVIYALHSSLPHTQNGYGVRGHAILKALKTNGVDVSAVTRLGYPMDIDERTKGAARVFDNVEGVRYDRLLSSHYRLRRPTFSQYLSKYGEALADYAVKQDANVIHAASNYLNGFGALFAARRIGVPFLYEMRGLWEVTRGSLDPDWRESEQFAIDSRLEAQLANEADAVVTLTEGIRGEMVRRGVPAEKMIVVPNGVDSEAFVPIERDNELEEALGLCGKVVIGYIGSVVDYEGLDDLISACRILVDQGVVNFKLVIVGDGVVRADLEKQVAELSLVEYVLFTGRVPHDQVDKYYSVMDITPLPRKPLEVCELVSPLKPFEMMAMEKAVLFSDVGALREIVRDGETGLLFKKGDCADMASRLRVLIEDRDLRRRLGGRAREWIVQEREWTVLVRAFQDLYKELVVEFQNRRGLKRSLVG